MGEQLIICSRYFSRWHAYVEDKEIKIYSVNDTFIGLNSPKSGDYTIILKYEEGTMENTSKYLFFISLFILLSFTSYFFLKNSRL